MAVLMVLFPPLTYGDHPRRQQALVANIYIQWYFSFVSKLWGESLSPCRRHL